MLKIMQFLHQAVFFMLEPMGWESVTLHFTLHYSNEWSVSCEQLNFHNFTAALLMPNWIFYFSFSRKSFHSEVVLLPLLFQSSDFELSSPLCSGSDCSSPAVCFSFPQCPMESFRHSSYVLQVSKFLLQESWMSDCFSKNK